MDTPFPFAFEARVEAHDFGRFAYTVVYLPEAMRAALPFDRHPRLRVEGEIADHPFEGAWQPGQGRMFLMVPKAIQQEAGIGLGDEVEVRFRVADQDAVDVPVELRLGLAEDDAAEAAWRASTAGKRRGMAYHVASAKRATTRARRVAEVLEALRGGAWPPARPRRSRPTHDS